MQATLVNNGALRLDLRAPGFTVASRVVAAINQRFGERTASAVDGGTVSVRVPENGGSSTSSPPSKTST